MTDAIRRAASGDYSVRIGVSGNADELDSLASEIDELLNSLGTRITKFERDKEASREAREQYRRLEANIPGMVYTYCLHPDGSYSFPSVNAASRELFGVEPEDAMVNGPLIVDLIHPDDQERRDASILRSAETLGPWREELRHIVNGEVRWYDCMSRPDLQPDGSILWTGIILETTERKRAEEALRESEAKYRRLHESMIDAFASTEITGRIQEANRAFQAMVGYSEEELRQLTYSDLTPEKWHAFEAEIASQQVLVRGYSEVFEKEYRRKDGSIVPVELRVVALRDSAGQPTGMWAIVRDITERVRAKRTIEEANRRLEQSLDRARHLAFEASQASRAKSAFLANISHEIRTPLSGVIGMAELLLETGLSAEQQEYAGTVRSSAKTLLVLLNDILDFSKIEAGKLELETLDFDLRVTVEEVCDLMSFRVVEKRLDLVCLVEPGVPSLLRGDPARLRQVLINLVGNAVKFTERGEVSLLVGLESEDPEGATLRFSVSDTGIGIESESLAQVFQPFSQADASTTRRYGGTGLGLSICRGLVDVMGSELHASSELGIGSTFWFTLRLARQTIGGDGREAVEDALLGVRVLVAEDCASNRRLVRLLAESWGCLCEEAGAGEQALDMIRAAAGQRDPFRVAILDAEMPGMGGEEVGEGIRNDTRLAETTVVLMRSIGRDPEASGAGQASFVAALPKPVRRSRLKRSLLEAVRAPDNSESAPSEPAGHLVPRSQWRLHVLVTEDNPVNRKVLVALLEKLGCHADGAADGREALNALRTTDYDLVFMDCQMPVMDGYHAARAIRDPHSKVLNHEVPIVAVTAHAVKGDQEKCLQAGMNSYLAKPVSLRTLDVAIRSCVREAGVPPPSD